MSPEGGRSAARLAAWAPAAALLLVGGFLFLAAAAALSALLLAQFGLTASREPSLAATLATARTNEFNLLEFAWLRAGAEAPQFEGLGVDVLRVARAALRLDLPAPVR